MKALGAIHSCLCRPSTSWIDVLDLDRCDDEPEEEGRGEDDGNQTTETLNFLLATSGGEAEAIEVDFSNHDSDTCCSESNTITVMETEQREGRNRSPSPLMEIYSVRFLDKDDNWLLNHIFGVIAIQCSSGTSSILFNRKVGDPRHVTPQVTLIHIQAVNVSPSLSFVILFMLNTIVQFL
jgi:hypothetical protein